MLSRPKLINTSPAPLINTSPAPLINTSPAPLINTVRGLWSKQEL